MKEISFLLTSLCLWIPFGSCYGVPRIRLMDGNSSCSGRLEILHNDSWAAVCYQPSSWTIPITGKDLKQKGCGTVLQIFPEVPSRQTPVPFLKYNTTCFTPLGDKICNHSIIQTDSCESKKYILINSSSSAISDVRLVNGNSSSDGTLEIFFNHSWHRVSSEGHARDFTVAYVACKQLDHPIMIKVLSISSGSHHVVSVACSGEENHLSDCLSYAEGPFSYTSQHLGVVCSQPGLNFRSRLVGGETPCVGQVEVFVEDSWKMICYEGQGIQPAVVVCKELRCGSAVDVVRKFGLWSTAGQVWKYYFECQGQESKLSQCRHNWKGAYPCKYAEDTVGVTCSGSSVSQVRLMGGKHSCEGTVEVYYNNTWGTVCDHEWDIRDAAVVCRQAGCGPATEATVEAGIGGNSGPVWLDNVFCTGTEADLSLCGSQMLLQNHRCNSSGRAGVRCSSSGITNVRLVNGSSHCGGRLEVYYDSEWGTVCNEDWDVRDAAVVCKQLGCGSAVEDTQQNPFGPGSGPVWLKRVFCSGSESHLSQCGSWMSQQFACSHIYDIGVTCLSADAAISNVRLVNGKKRCDGKLEIYSNNIWGRAHSDLHDHALWDLPDAIVVCKHLGCGPVREVTPKQEAYEGKTYGNMRGFELFGDYAPREEEHLNVKYLPRSMFCSGTESSVSQCASKKMTLQPYQHIYIECSDSGVSGVRLVDGDSSCSGRVEVNYSNAWGTVCDYRWDIEDATVVCRELGCGSAVEAPRGARFKAGSGPVWLKAVFCSGNEAKFSQCGSEMSDRYPCDHSRDAGVICSGQEHFWTSVVLRFFIYTFVFASIHLGFFLYGYLEDKNKKASRQYRV
ncbi:deleted in malignant brain tumors 1 protein-like [Microcaecilia unicolor]|uniref:Deleted in malignant brain tumors 1 protein-like n=1 Tax=Microcaecilia unicolor TaxID=1415580 RepID=A0A6P7X5K9_9AMPH|nr:deleted in malignant brain tumors 1 protein-like [Microcaecilia unicolor]